MTRSRSAQAVALMLVVGFCAHEGLTDTVNVKDLGAVGDGKADDTEVIQKALNSNAAEVLFPAGIYRITKTLTLVRTAPTQKHVRDRTFRGEGSRTILEWDGERGGILLKSAGMGHCKWESLWFRGQTHKRRVKDRKDQAGILFLLTSSRGSGNMINHFSFCQFTQADAGLQFGTRDAQVCNADVSFEHLNFQYLGKCFYTRNSQAVDFLFNYMFVTACGTVFYMERGGNLLVNNCQVTDSPLVLFLGGGGRGAATYTLNNVRIEGNSRQSRHQLMKAPDIFWEQALVRFTGFDDVFWQWCRNPGENRGRPLCEIGPGVNVTFESFAFNSPVAELTGKEGKPASLVVRECTFGFLNPTEAISANKFGYFKTENCFTDHMDPYPDVKKWPKLPTMQIPADSEYKAVLPPPMPDCEKAIEENRKRQKAWIERLQATE